MTSHTSAEIHLEARVDSEALTKRATLAGMSVDSRKLSVSAARPYIVVIHGDHQPDLDLPSLWEDMPTAKVESYVEGDDG